jgi:hypothetical protein
LHPLTSSVRKAAACLTAALGSIVATIASAAVVTPHPILFVTQVPVGAFGTVTSIFDNHEPSPQQAPRGGDLVLRYPNGALRFLTSEAGFGTGGQQGANAIAVREPCVHWSGEKALFSMVVGAPTAQYDLSAYRWQIYEVSGLAEGATATIRRIENQPSEFNNVSPIYGSGSRILFVSDRPPSGAAHHYPLLDESAKARACGMPTRREASVAFARSIWRLGRSADSAACASRSVSCAVSPPRRSP